MKIERGWECLGMCTGKFSLENRLTQSEGGVKGEVEGRGRSPFWEEGRAEYRNRPWSAKTNVECVYTFKIHCWVGVVPDVGFWKYNKV